MMKKGDDGDDDGGCGEPSGATSLLMMMSPF